MKFNIGDRVKYIDNDDQKGIIIGIGLKNSDQVAVELNDGSIRKFYSEDLVIDIGLEDEFKVMAEKIEAAKSLLKEVLVLKRSNGFSGREITENLDILNLYQDLNSLSEGWNSSSMYC